MAETRVEETPRNYITSDHDTIRRWAESRGGRPVALKRTGAGGDDPASLRIDFGNHDGANELEALSWEAWFERFDRAELSLIYHEDEPPDGRSHFAKTVRRE